MRKDKNPLCCGLPVFLPLAGGKKKKKKGKKKKIKETKSVVGFMLGFFSFCSFEWFFPPSFCRCFLKENTVKTLSKYWSDGGSSSLPEVVKWHAGL